MCGIVGVFNLDGNPFSLPILQSMTRKLAHRGPDGEGYYIHEEIALAHKRLAILDTSSKGSQPMSSKSGNWIIIFNGCIYNFMDLKQELHAKGHSFNTTCDTEVIAEGLDHYGPSFFERLNIIGSMEKKLFLPLR
jgi:asparagine synthase (glutamine-hydrolysing)